MEGAILVYDDSARTAFLQLSYEDALRELSAAVDRNFGDRKTGEERLSDLLNVIPEDDWRINEPIREQLEWLAVGQDSLTERAQIVLLKRERPRK